MGFCLYMKGITPLFVWTSATHCLSFINAWFTSMHFCIHVNRKTFLDGNLKSLLREFRELSYVSGMQWGLDLFSKTQLYTVWRVPWSSGQRIGHCNIVMCNEQSRPLKDATSIQKNFTQYFTTRQRLIL